MGNILGVLEITEIARSEAQQEEETVGSAKYETLKTRMKYATKEQQALMLHYAVGAAQDNPKALETLAMAVEYILYKFPKAGEKE